MNSPFPGMDPYLEHRALWPDVHNSLIAAPRDVLAQAVAPRYYVALEQRAYLLTPDDIVLVGRPELSMVGERSRRDVGLAPRQNGVLEVEVPMADELYGRARFDLRLDYSQPAVPPLAPDDALWTAALIGRR